jgi:predicted secreted protein
MMTVAGLAKSTVGNMKKRTITVTATATVNSAIKSIGGHTAPAVNCHSSQISKHNNNNSNNKAIMRRRLIPFSSYC